MRPRQNSLTHPRGRLPARVYWVRRGLVAVTALALVFGFAQLLGSLGGGSGSGGETARLSADQHDATTPATRVPLLGKRPSAPVGPVTSPSSSPSEVLAEPDGPCSPDELSVAPTVAHAYALQPVVIKLRLSGSSPACTFKVSPRTVAVKVVSGKDHIWSTQDCPQGVKKQTVVVRSGHDTVVPVTWGGHRSRDGDCSVSYPWALPGYYHALAAVLGSTPADTQFKLTVAPREVITKTAHPKKDHSGESADQQESKADKTDGTAKADKGDKAGTGKDHTSGSNGSACGGDNAASSC